MSVFSKIGSFFGKVGGLLAKAWDLVKLAGVDDELIAFALKWIRIADSKYVDNTERREWVVQQLLARKIPESIARLVVELAYQLYRAELKKLNAKIS